MFTGLESVGSNQNYSETEADTKERMENEDSAFGDQNGTVAHGRTETNAVEEIMTRIQDIENKLPEFEPRNANDVPIAFLSDTATLQEVIKVVNKLIKRDLTVYRIK